MDVADGQAWLAAFPDRLRGTAYEGTFGAFWIDRDGHTARVGM